MTYDIVFTPEALRAMKKLDNFTQRIILNWFENHNVIQSNPRIIGRDLKGKLGEYWRYRIGNLRIIVRIDDQLFKIYILSIGPRDQIYK